MSYKSLNEGFVSMTTTFIPSETPLDISLREAFDVEDEGDDLTLEDERCAVEEDFSQDGDYWFQGQHTKKNRFEVERRSRDEKHKNSILKQNGDYFTGEGTVEGKSKAKEIRDFGDDFYSAEDYYKDNLSDKYTPHRRNKKEKPNEGKVVK